MWIELTQAILSSRNSDFLTNLIIRYRKFLDLIIFCRNDDQVVSGTDCSVNGASSSPIWMQVFSAVQGGTEHESRTALGGTERMSRTTRYSELVFLIVDKSRALGSNLRPLNPMSVTLPTLPRTGWVTGRNTPPVSLLYVIPYIPIRPNNLFWAGFTRRWVPHPLCSLMSRVLIYIYMVTRRPIGAGYAPPAVISIQRTEHEQ